MFKQYKHTKSKNSPSYEYTQPRNTQFLDRKAGITL